MIGITNNEPVFFFLIDFFWNKEIVFSNENIIFIIANADVTGAES